MYLLGLHVKYNRQHAIYTRLLLKKHVIMLQTHMEINAGWKVQDLLLVLQEVAVIQYWGLALLPVSSINNLANLMEPFVLIKKPLVTYINRSHQVLVRLLSLLLEINAQITKIQLAHVRL